MSKKSVFCIATSRDQADKIVIHLKKENFSNSDISVLFADKNKTRNFAHEKDTKAPEGVPSLVRSSAARWAGSQALARWPCQELDRLPPPDRLWPR
jgi:hypothetical protein